MGSYLDECRAASNGQRLITWDQAADFLAREYPDNVNTNAFCAALRSQAVRTTRSVAETAPALTLTWDGPHNPNDYCSYDHCFADTSFGRYQIEWKSWKDYPGYTVEFGCDFINCADSLDEAKQIARDDYRERIARSVSNHLMMANYKGSPDNG